MSADISADRLRLCELAFARGFVLRAKWSGSGDYLAGTAIHNAKVALVAEGKKALQCSRFFRQAGKPKVDNDSFGLAAVQKRGRTQSTGKAALYDLLALRSPDCANPEPLDRIMWNGIDQAI